VENSCVWRWKATTLTSFGEDGSYAAISRQGHRLVYARNLEDANIWRVAVPGVQGKAIPPMNFISSTRYDAAAQYSPDGKKIAFNSDRSGSFEIWVCDSNGANAVQITSFGALSIDPRWSPDSERVVFDSNVEGQPGICVVSVNGEKPRRLTSDQSNDQNPCWSRDRRWIYFDSNRNESGGIWKTPAQGGDAIPVTRSGGFAPIESPDGKFVYYQNGLDGGITLWKVPVEGGEENQVLDFPIVWFHCAIVDEGIYFIPDPKSGAGPSIHFFSFDTRSIKRIAAIEKPPCFGLSVSPDRRWILYSQIDQYGSDLMLVEKFH
jgi:Tol biopolymer transport system component